MAIRYYDHTLGRERIKPRYKWAMSAFAIGIVCGVVFAHVI